VHRDLFTGPHDDEVTHLHVLDRDVEFASVAPNARSLGLEVDQLADGFRSLALGPRLEEPAHQDQYDDDGGCLVIDLWFYAAGDELPAQRGNLSPASLALVIVHGLAHHFKWLVASLAHRSTQIGHRRRRDRLDGGALHGEVY